MPGTDSYQQNYPYPKLSDSPNIEAATSALVNAVAPRTNMVFASASARNAAIPTPVAGMETWLIAEGRKDIYSGSAWLTYSPAVTYGVWSDYVPTWTASGTAPSVGNGSLTGRYCRIGNTVMVTIKLVFGTTTSAGSGVYSFGLPYPSASMATGYWVGSALATDTGNSNYPADCALDHASSTTIGIGPSGTGGSNPSGWSNTNPFTWGNTDSAALTLTYECAP